MLDYGGFRIETRTIETILVASIRWRGKYADSNAAFSRLYGEFGRYACGKAMDLYHDDCRKADDADIESAIPISTARQVAGITIRELSGGKALTLMHQGPYDSIGVAFERLTYHMRKHQLRLQLPTRVVYIKGPGLVWRKPKKYLSEVVFLVE
jgi:effector-binding domain-containing protein